MKLLVRQINEWWTSSRGAPLISRCSLPHLSACIVFIGLHDVTVVAGD